MKKQMESCDGERKRPSTKGWKWALFGAFIVLCLAGLAASRNAPKISLFGISKSCLCSDSRKYTGIVEDCCCDYETVDTINEAVLHPILQELVTTPFFRYFKVKLWCDCPFWPDDGMCRLRDCSVCECPENEFPESFKKSHGLPSDDLICQEGKPEAAVDRTLDSKAFRGWVEIDNPWTNDDETDNAEMTYVNLQLNPERYTGYTGPSAQRIWDAWGQNLELLYDRVLRYPDRVSNLYFTFLFVLRAVTKAADYLEQAEYDTGNHLEDLKTQSLMRQLVHNPKLQSACPVPFDEAKLWQGQSGPELKQEIQKQFRNISALMDCVGCEKCRLWGKLQVLGLGTALKILFSVDGKDDSDHSQEEKSRAAVEAAASTINGASTLTRCDLTTEKLEAWMDV
ncbi:Endoplasmic reticulum oxidoreductin-1 [Asimina triloba]